MSNDCYKMYFLECLKSYDKATRAFVALVDMILRLQKRSLKIIRMSSLASEHLAMGGLDSSSPVSGSFRGTTGSFTFHWSLASGGMLGDLT